MKKPIKILSIAFLSILVFLIIVTTSVNRTNIRHKETLSQPIIDELFLECDKNIDFEILNSCYNIRSSEITIQIKNKGTLAIYGANFITDENFVIETNDIIAKDTTGSYFLSSNKRPRFIEMIPKMQFNNVAHECSSLRLRIDDLSNC